MESQIKTDREVDGFVGRVKSVKIERARLFKQSGKWREAERVLDSINSYDAAGALIADESTPRTILDLFIAIMRNPALPLDLDPDDPAAEFIKKILSHRDESRESCTYDAQGNPIEKVSYDPDGTVSTKAVYKYDEKGNITEETVYGGEGMLVIKEAYAYEYDSTGNWVERISSGLRSKRGKTYLEPAEVIYRTIIYY